MTQAIMLSSDKVFPTSEYTIEWISHEYMNQLGTRIYELHWVICMPHQQWVRLLNHVLISINSSPPSAAYMHQPSRSALVQVMTCCLFGTKPFPKPMLAYIPSDSWEHISVKFKFSLKKMYLIFSSAKMADIFFRGEMSLTISGVPDYDMKEDPIKKFSMQLNGTYMSEHHSNKQPDTNQHVS